MTLRGLQTIWEATYVAPIHFAIARGRLQRGMMGEGDPPVTVFMIVAHSNPGLLARLAGRLEAPWARTLLMIDQKADLASFERALAGRSAAFMPPETRVNVQWGGIGLTMAAIRMMREALVRWPVERFCMLSGVDYPVRPIEEIGRRLAGDTEFVRVDRRLDPTRTGVHDDFVRYSYFNDVRLLNPRSSPFPLLQRAATRTLHLRPRQERPELVPYHGSGWWCISGDAARWALDHLDRHPGFLAWLRHVNCPDEIFLQTLLKASPFAGRIAQDGTRAGTEDDQDPNVHGCHYVDWSDSTSSSPKILAIEDLDRMVRSTALFARKIDPVRSAPLLAALDERAERHTMV